jgi:nitroreductase
MNKAFLKKIVPVRIQALYKALITIKVYWYDIKRIVRVTLSEKYAEQRFKRDLSVQYHRVEKGLTMPEIREGFGLKLISDLINQILIYEKKGFQKKSLEYIQAVSVVNEYIDFHKGINYIFDPEFTHKLSQFECRYSDIKGVNQIKTTRDEYFLHNESPFEDFSISRHSVRNYTNKEIPLSVIENCITIAQTSPSFCNRQPSRVHIVKSKNKKAETLRLQGGNRGFGHLADTVLVVTSVISTTIGPTDRYANHLNSGMFCMNLLYALHYNKIGACSLNWSVTNDRDQQLRQLLNIQDNEFVVMVITCGYVPDNFMLASSPRLKAGEITYYHN